jgi:hypothetical protein
VGDFSYAFTQHRNKAGANVANGNPKAATFVGTTISKWNTTTATSLYFTFYGASEMNADLSGWKVGKVVTLAYTFCLASKFTGTGLSAWGVAKVTIMSNTFAVTTSLSSCNKRKIADAWKSNAAFAAYDTAWTSSTCVGVQQTDAQFKEASWDWVQNLPDTATATTKWGDIGDWDTSGVGDFSYAFSQHRNQAGGSLVNGNPKAATFVGTSISKWDTASATTLYKTFDWASEMNADLAGWKVGKVVTLAYTFNSAPKFTGTGLSAWDTASATTLSNTFRGASGASEMNADLTGWKVGKVVTLLHTFIFASKFVGTGLSAWDVAKVNDMRSTFFSATSLTTCNKRKIADAWKSSAAFVATSYDEDWAADTCTVRFE